MHDIQKVARLVIFHAIRVCELITRQLSQDLGCIIILYAYWLTMIRLIPQLVLFRKGGMELIIVLLT